MSDYYIQLDGDYVNNGRGAGTQADPFNSIALNELLNGWNTPSAQSGDTIYLRGTLALGRYYELGNVYVSSGSFESGDLIGDTPNPADCTSRSRIVRIVNETTWLAYVDENHQGWTQVYNYSRPGQAYVYSDLSNPGLTCSVSGDIAGGFINIIGCPGDSWIPDGQRATIDAEGIAWRCLFLECSYTRLENIHLTRGAYSCLEAASTAYRHILVNCEASFSGGSGGGLRLLSGNFSQLIGCDIHDNTYYGVYLQQSSIHNSRISNNGRQGVFAAYLVNICNSVISGNGTSGDYSGIYISNDGGCVSGCVVDGNAGDGIAIAATKGCHSIYANRISNNGGYGISHDGSAGGCYSDYNFLFANTSGEYYGPPPGGSDICDAESDGYVDSASGNYSLANDTPGRRIAVSIGPDSLMHLSAGLTPPDIRRDMQLSFSRHEVTFI